jgi:SAM-dependent methyltransferase
MFDGFQKNGARFVNQDYMCYQADSVTLGKNWDEEPFDVIFVDTIHTREQVLTELYYWADNLKPGGYFVFHDSHWEGPGDVIGGVQHERVDVAITDFFGLPKSVREMDIYEDDNVIINHHKPSFGMTFVKVKTANAIEKFKSNIDWNHAFETRNWLADLHFNPENSKYVDWNQDLDKIEYELGLTV